MEMAAVMDSGSVGRLVSRGFDGVLVTEFEDPFSDRLDAHVCAEINGVDGTECSVTLLL